MTSPGSSTTQIRWASRRSSWQIRHRGSTARLKQTSHRPTVSLTSRIASASGSASSGGTRSRWNASRWAVRCPMPGSRESSVTRRFTGGASTGSRLELHQEVQALHPPKAEPLIERMRICGVERELPQALELGVRHHRAHQLLPDSAAAVRGQDEHIHEVRKRRAVGHDARESDLLVTLVRAEAE